MDSANNGGHRPPLKVHMPTCDSCTTCCKTMKIRELDKPGNVWCRHCAIGTGCRIYDERPESCRIYECVWLKSQAFPHPHPLPLALRPDRSRVVIGTANDGDDIILYVSPDRPDAWKQGEFGALIAKWQAKGMSLFTSCSDVLQKI